MNTTKILCKYLDEENKGFVDGADIFYFLGWVLVAIYILSSVFALIGEIVQVEIIKIGYYSQTTIQLYGPMNISIGFIVSSCVFVGGYIAFKLFGIFYKHKFAICDR